MPIVPLSLKFPNYTACLEVNVVVGGVLHQNIYCDLGLESLKLRIWLRELNHFGKILNEKFLLYLFNLIPNLNCINSTKRNNKIPPINVRHNYFKNSFFLLTLLDWNLTLKLEIQQP